MPDPIGKPMTLHLPAEEDKPIDDMLDGMDIHQWPEQFGQVIFHIHASLYLDYLKHDTAAMEHQEGHRWAARIAIGAGTTAILLSLVGIVLEAKGKDVGIRFAEEFSFWFLCAELAFFAAALFVIFLAKGKHWLQYWLEERFWAEEYRTRKFRALLMASLFCSPEKPWNERFSLWKKEFDVEVSARKSEARKSVGHCIASDTVSAPPPDISGCGFDGEYLGELVRYYQDMRLRIQIDYFDNRFDVREKQDDVFRKVLGVGFYLSILFVILKLGIDLLKPLIDTGNPVINFLAVVLTNSLMYICIILFILILPIIAFAVRTLRSSGEVARTASLYRANRNALEDFRNRLIVENERVPRNWEETIKILWECENHLERVNCEWVRIMHEAEWFV